MIPVAACGIGEVGLSMMGKGGGGGEGPVVIQIIEVPQSVFEHIYQFHLRILSSMTVRLRNTRCTGSDSGEGGKASVLEWPPKSDSVLSAGQYFATKTTAN